MPHSMPGANCFSAAGWNLLGDVNESWEYDSNVVFQFVVELLVIIFSGLWTPG